MNWKPIPNEEVKWLGVDFDKTIANTGGHPDYIPREPLPGAVEALKALDKKGYKIVIYTARHWADYINIEAYCKEYGIPVRRIICGKPLFKWIIDDKNIEFDGDWGKVTKKL